MKQSLTRPLLTACSAAGLAISGYLAAFSFQTQGVCELDALFSCDAVLSSDYSKIMGVPVAYLGVAWFALATGLSSASFIRTVPPRLLLTWAIIGVLAIPPLLYTEVFLIGSVCPLCTAAQILAAAFLGLSVMYRPHAA